MNTTSEANATLRSAAARRDEPGPVRAAAPDAVLRRAAHENLRFGICVTILLVSAVSMQAVARAFGHYFSKQPVPLKRPLAALDRSKLLPQYVLHPIQPPPIPPDVLQTLGTEEYLNLRLVDQSRPPTDPAALAHLFITYYTGQPDMVPHVPDYCYQAGGYDSQGARNVEIRVPDVGAEEDRIPVRMLAFGVRGEGLVPAIGATPAARMYVMYFFHTNGAYRTTRDEVRLRVAKLTDRYAYYAKFEARFTDATGRVPAGESESLAALERLMGKVLPIVLQDHFADWEALRRGAAGASGSAGSGAAR